MGIYRYKICDHQWFEVEKLSKSNHSSECDRCTTGKICISDYSYGVKVICANCEETKELWGE